MLLRLTIGLVFIVVPMLELMLLIKIGQTIGVWATVALVLSTALAGAFIISRQSLGVVARTLEALSEGRAPVEPVADGLFLLLAGALLVTPGLVTDVVALALLVPPLRRVIARACTRWALARARVRVRTHEQAGGPRSWRAGPAADLGDGPIIDIEPERVDEPPPRSRPTTDREGRRGSDT
jgi:UPF0716 protein FxsA